MQNPPKNLHWRHEHILTKTRDNAEITLECNPRDDIGETLKQAATAGVNRVSIGLQSASRKHLRFLGRTHTAENAAQTAESTVYAGITNISFDMMIGLPDETKNDIKKTVEFCENAGATHISAYILKTEPNTPLYQQKDSLSLPDDDRIAEIYLQTVDILKKHGYGQYEISNFCKPDYHSRHNLIYWNCDEYIGIGASAHSFWNKKRFYYEHDINRFTRGIEPVSDGVGGGIDEYIMLRLRLCDGLNLNEAEKRGLKLNDKILKRLEIMQNGDLLNMNDKKIVLTPKGFLVQNQIVAQILGDHNEKF